MMKKKVEGEKMLHIGTFRSVYFFLSSAQNLGYMSIKFMTARMPTVEKIQQQ